MDERRRRFEAQVMPHLDAASNLARWLARDRELANDVVQDAVLRAFRAFDGVRGDDAKPWLLAIVRNCHRTALSQRKRRGQVALPEDDTQVAEAMKVEAPDPEAAAISADQTRKLNAVISTLPPESREPLILREM